MEDLPSQGIRRRIKALFRRFKNGDPADRFEEEIQDLIDHGAEKGVITQGEGEMIQSIFELGETLAREIMIPRTEINAVPTNTPLGTVMEKVIGNGNSRLPIYEEDIDHIIGILHAKDLLSYWGLPPDEPLPQEIVRPAIFTSATKKIVELLSELRAKKSHMAIVLDEYGGTAGLVTLEDIIEEIIGDIHDEYDIEEETITRLDQETVLVDARVNLEDLGEYLNIELPEGEYETLGGFLTALTGRVPQENENVDFNNLRMIIRAADERKIKQVEIKLTAGAAQTATEQA